MPKGSLLKQYLPNGMTNIVNNQDSSARGFCENPLLVSSLLKILAPVNRAKASSTCGRG